MKTCKTLILILLVSLFPIVAQAKTITQHKGEVENGYNFWLVEPDDTSEEKPVVIFLHGASLCGYDLNKVRRYGTLDAVEKGRQIDAYVIAPQNPGGSWKPEKIMNVLEWVEARHNVDKNRVYVLGMSLGGYGTMDFAATYPDKVAAAIAMCGGATKDVSRLNEVPLWIIHGTGDRDVPVSASDKVVDKMESIDAETPRLVYDRIPGMNHSQPARVFYMPETYEWLFSHSLTDEGRPLAAAFELTSGQMAGAYKNLNHSAKKSTSSNSSTTKKTSTAKKSTSKNSKTSSKKSTKKK